MKVHAASLGCKRYPGIHQHDPCVKKKKKESQTSFSTPFYFEHSDQHTEEGEETCYSSNPTKLNITPKPHAFSQKANLQFLWSRAEVLPLPESKTRLGCCKPSFAFSSLHSYLSHKLITKNENTQHTACMFHDEPLLIDATPAIFFFESPHISFTMTP